MLSIIHHNYINLPKNYLGLCMKHVATFSKVQYREEPRWHQHQACSNRLLSGTCCCSRPEHFVCLQDWSESMVKTILHTAMSLKYQFGNTHRTRTGMLTNSKVMLLEDHKEPLERIALSKATSLLGADEVHITTDIKWDHDYYSKIYSEMADVIFVSTMGLGCVRKFANQSAVPVIVMRSRVHSSIQSLATIMSILEEYGTLININVAYIGWPHQVINDYLLLCPMLRANFVFKCSCSVCPVSPLMLAESTCACKRRNTNVKQSTDTKETLRDAVVIISGPAAKKKEKIPEFQLSVQDIQACTNYQWTYYHTLPRGPEVGDELFWHVNSRSFNAFRNMQYICAALLIHSLK